MIRKLSQLIFMIMVLITTGCIKETYDMNKLSKKVRLSPTIALSAIKGNILMSDIVKESDTVVFDQNKLVKIVFKKDSVINLTLADFFIVKNMIELSGKDKLLTDLNILDPGFENIGQMIATIDPDTLNLEIEDVLSHISGDLIISNPSIKLSYSNSFAVPVEINLKAAGVRKAKTVNLDLAPFILTVPQFPDQQNISDTYIADTTNSSLSELISLPPEKIYFSGTAMLNTLVKNSQYGNYAVSTGRIIGGLEVEIPLDFRMNNLQFTDTVDNFIKDDGSSNDNSVKPENFELLRIDVTAKNGFPFGVSLKMSLYDSLTQTIKSTVNATDLLEPAPVDSNGKVSGTTDTGTSIEFTKEFFSAAGKADKIIFQFTLNTTGSGSKDVKIYSDYRIDFNAALVVKPDINLK